jgi:hypothetical protein
VDAREQQHPAAEEGDAHRREQRARHAVEQASRQRGDEHEGQDRRQVDQAGLQGVVLELPAAGDRPWPEAVEEIACLLRARVAGYPGVAAYLLTAPAPGPNAQRIMERLLALLTEGAGLPVLAAFDAYQVLMAFVLNSVQRTEQGTTASRIARYAELGARDDLPLTRARGPDPARR